MVARYEPGASWDPVPLSPGTAVMALLRNTVAIRSRSREALVALSASVRDAEAYESVRGDATQMVEALLSRRLG